MENAHLLPFEGKEIRKVWHDEQWYFVLVDVIEVLTDSKDPKQYLEKLKKRDQELDSYLRTNCTYVGVKSDKGKTRKYLCANTEGILRIVMSVPSPKAEPIRLWLAQVGKERFEEMEQPEIGVHRNLEYYKAKGYTDEWIKNRLETITTRNKLTDEWGKRAVKEGKEYSILTAIIAKGTFGLFPSEHKKLKGLTKPSQDLRDNMTALELIFTQLGEETTRQLAVKENAQGFEENKDKAVKGGKATGVALDTYETQTGLKVVSSENFLPPSKGTDSLPESNELKE
jgi:DNA-damage-inducible protein D